MTDNKGLPVKGYASQSDSKVAVVNVHKELEERVLRRIETLQRDNTAAASLNEKPPYDPRMLALATTGIQEAFMWLNRAVFQPTRVELPEDIATP